MRKKINPIIAKFPKTRSVLGKEYHKIFDYEYKMNREGSIGFIGKLAKRMEQWMHKKVSRTSTSGDILEVGAGTLNHLDYESSFENYDIVEPYHKSYADKIGKLKRIRGVYGSLSDIPIARKYAKIISIATLEHMVDLPAELGFMYDRLEKDGVLEVGIPSEGGLLWGFAWRVTTAISYYFRTGLSYKKLMEHEHVNTADEIIAIIGSYFNDMRVERYPFNYKHLSFYTYISARK